MVRAPYIDKNGLKKGAWTREEDDKLRAYIKSYGPWNWRQLPKFAGLARCGKSCRLRWINYLRPGVKHGNYSKEEEELIIKLHGQHGNKWALIAGKLHGRTDNDIKNYWHAHLKKRSMQDQNEFQDAHDRFRSIQEKSSEEASQSGISQNRHVVVEAECGSDNSTTTTYLHSMLSGSFSSLSQEASPTEFPGLSSDAEEVAVPAGSGTNWNMVDGSLTSSFEENSSADFWTTPFLLDDTYEKDCYTSFWQKGGLNFISYDQYFDESLDFFYQAMQEMKQRSS